MKPITITGLFLACTAPIFASPHHPASNNLVRRQASQSCPSLQANSGKGGRKVAIVIDTSGSNVDTDPNNLRIVAGKSLNEALISRAEAGNGRDADLVTLVDFDGSATVLYALGDPAGAGPAFDKLDSSGSTAIFAGVKAALDELSKPGNDPTKDRSGVVVLTDGEDSSITSLITQLERAASLGIRVSFGFLAGDGSSQPSRVLSAILKTGGIYSGISNASGQQAFVSLVFSHGLTNSDSVGGTSTLLAGLNLAAFVANPGPNTFAYDAQDGEKLNFTLNSVTAGTLDATLKDGSGTELKKASTNSAGHVELVVDIAKGTKLELSVKASNMSSEALFTVYTNSSLGISNCTLPTTNVTQPPSNTTASPNVPTQQPNVPTQQPPLFTGAAASVLRGWPIAVGKAGFATAILVFAGALM